MWNLLNALFSGSILEMLVMISTLDKLIIGSSYFGILRICFLFLWISITEKGAGILKNPDAFVFYLFMSALSEPIEHLGLDFRQSGHTETPEDPKPAPVPWQAVRAEALLPG